MKVDGVPPVLFPHQYKSTPKSGEFTLESKKSPDEQLQHLEKDMESSSPMELSCAVEQLNKLMLAYNTEISFQVHEDSGEHLVRIINSLDKTVIREIPPERVLDMVAHLKKIVGIIIDEFI